LASCPRGAGRASDFKENLLSGRKDSFRRGLAAAWSKVAPQSVVFHYETSQGCDYFHGKKIPGPITGKEYGDLREALASEGGQACWIPRALQRITQTDLKEAILSGREEGFVTVRGGREGKNVSATSPAAARFGFCVQSWAPSPDSLGEFTLKQVALHNGWSLGEEEGLRKTRELIKRQPPRTLNDITFRSEETVSTTYLRWLMEERGFEGFRITHFLSYNFSNFGKDFIEEVLQKRHEEKRAKNLVAAECLKLIGNGSYGYNALESCNYSTVKLIDGCNLRRRMGSDLAHLNWRHVSLLGVIEKRSVIRRRARATRRRSAKGGSQKTQLVPATKERVGSSKKSPRRRAQPSVSALSLLSREALVDDDDDDDEDDGDSEGDNYAEEGDPGDRSDGLTEEREPQEGNSDGDSELSSSSDVDEIGDESSDDDRAPPRTDYINHARQMAASQQGPSSGIPPMEWAIDRLKKGLSCLCNSEGSSLSGGDHTYARPPGSSRGQQRQQQTKEGKKTRKTYEFLYAVSFSGELKLIKNTLPRAVAILSNSKRLFLGHLNLMLRCLDPRKAELCYIDTDSCIWSFAEQDLARCLLEEKLAEWDQANILADESSDQSCHGKLKLEGMFAYGEFRSLKMYRLWKEPPAMAPVAHHHSADGAGEHRPAPPGEIYTRCKGVTRATAGRLPDVCFETREVRDPTIVHRTSLRPTRTGEILMVREGRCLSVPFNLKRRVTFDGLHTLPLSSKLKSPSDTDDEDEGLLLQGPGI
jgi:hypothetical protein